jgi:hypothetical protein
MRRLTAALAFLATPALATTPAPGPTTPVRTEGLYRVTVAIEIPGSPMTLPPVTVEHCCRGDEVVPRTPHDQGCEQKELRREGTTVHYRLTCDNERGLGELRGSITYTAEGYTGAVDMTLKDRRGRDRTMKQTMSAVRLGDCKE